LNRNLVSGGCSVGDTNDDDGFLQLPSTGGSENEGLENLLVERSSEGCETWYQCLNLGCDSSSYRIPPNEALHTAHNKSVTRLRSMDRSEGSEAQSGSRLTREFDLRNELKSLLLGSNVVTLDARVEESDLDTVLVHQRGDERDSRENPGGQRQAQAKFTTRLTA